MKKIKIGVLGAYRGSSMINYCRVADNAELVAICDKWEEGLNRQKEQNGGLDIAYYNNFEEFIKHDMDAVILANYATEHAPFAIKAMKIGKHVYSEVLPVQTLKEAVELVETVEETGMTYAYGENYCFMAGTYEMRRLYQEDKIGEFEYGECEYLHNCESIWPFISYGDPEHWRNRMYANFYCTHSLGPIIHITGLKPASVVGFEGTKNERGLRVGKKGGQFGIEMVTLENGGIVKSTHGELYKNSIWYSVYGAKGRMETARMDTKNGDFNRIYVNVDSFSGEYGEEKIESYIPSGKLDKQSAGFGHGGSDFYCMYNFVEKLRGNQEADIIDVYEALDMFLPGLMAYRSVLKGSVPVEIPDLRDRAIREKYRNDTACVSPEVAGDMLLPTCSKGTPKIDRSVYEIMKRKFKGEITTENKYMESVFTQGIKKTNEEERK